MGRAEATEVTGHRLSPLFTWRAEVARSGLGSSAKLTALVLSLYMSEAGESCFPTQGRLVEETSLARSTVQEALAGLESTGWLACRSGKAKGEPNHYFAQVPEGARPPGTPEGGGARPPGTGCPTTGHRGARPPGTSTTPKDHARTTKTVREQVADVYGYWREARGKTSSRYGKVSEARRAKIATRLTEFSVADLRRAIDGVACDPWTDRPKHDDITIIFRSREQVEKFLDLAESGPAAKPGLSAAEIARTAVRLHEEGR